MNDTTGSQGPDATTIDTVLNPRSVAVLGASDDTAKWGGAMLGLLRKFGYAGRVYPVNPRSARVQGLTAYPSAASIGAPVDVALLAVPHERAEAAFEDCARAGVKAILMVTSQFAESGEDGRALQDRLMSIARRAGIRVIGPNCMGYFNAHADLCLLNAQALLRNPVLRRGSIALVSQSGALAGAMLARAYDLGSGFSFCVSLGNQADLEVCDFLEYAVRDPNTRVIATYVEGLRDAARFVAALRGAREAGKPVLVLKAGRSESGQRAVQSHTASLAGSHAAFEAVVRHEGGVLVGDFVDLVNQAVMASTLPAPAGDRVAVLSGSGGGGAVTTDLVEDAGLRAASLAPATVEALSTLMPASNAHLPFDLGATPAHYRTPTWLGDVLAGMMADPGVDAGVFVMTTQPDMAGTGRTVVALNRGARKPLLFVNAASSCGTEATDALREAGLARFDSPRDALRALAVRVDAGRWAAVRDEAPAGLIDAQAVDAVAATLAAGVVSENDTKRLLAAAGVPVVRGEIASGAEEAVRIARELGFPVVMKLVSPQISHKSDVGGVLVGVRDEAAARTGFERLRAACATVPGAAFEGCLVQAMARADAELLVGTYRDAQFGAMLMAGFGGTSVELLRDTVLLPASAGPRTIAHALSRLVQYPLLTGWRGRAAIDLERLVDAIARIGALALHLGDRLAECEANPVMVRGDAIVVADARAVWKERA